MAADSWNRFAEDLAVVEALGSNVYRFSVEWSRVQPAPDSGIRPMVTLQHFTLPLWVAARGAQRRCSATLAPAFRAEGRAREAERLQPRPA